MQKQHYFFRENKVLNKINLDEIKLMVADKNYVNFVSKDILYKLRTTLDKALKQLPPG